MESFARRGIRTTVAVAGLAALGVGLAAPAFAVPGVPDVSGVGSTQPGVDHLGTPTGFAQASDTLGALPGAFAFEPPAVAESTEAAPSASDEQPSDDQGQADSTESESESTGTTDSTDAAPAATSPGLLPTIPGSPVNAQTNPQVSGLQPSSALQGLDSASMF